MENITNPQPFGSPLNLTYKGFFSTRLSLNKKSQYGHYLDKLYQVQFLGIGIHAATKFHDLMNAVILRKTSIDGRVEIYKATPDKYSESVILETLGGTLELKQTESVEVSLANREVVVPSALHDLLAIGYDVVTYGDLVDFYTAEQLRAADILIELIADSVAREAELDIKLASIRLNKLKMAESDIALISALKLNDKALLETTEEMSKTLIGLIHEVNRKDTLIKLAKQVDELKVKDALTNSTSGKILLDRIETLSKYTPLALDKGLEIFNKTTWGAMEIEELLLNSKDLSGVTLLGDTEADITTKHIVDVINSVEYRFKTKVAETLTNVIASELPVDNNMVILADMDSLYALVSKASVIAESAYLSEKLGKESLLEVLPMGLLNSRQASMAHYIMYRDSADYRKAIESSIASYIDSTSTNLQSVVETIQSLSRDILKDAEHGSDYFIALSVIDEVEVSYTGGLQFNSMARKAGESVKYKLRGATRPTNHAEIEYAHNVIAEDSKVYLATLEALYQDFKSMAKSANTIEPIIIRGMEINKDALVVEYLIGDKQAHNKGEVYNDYYSDKSIKSNTDANANTVYVVKPTKSNTELNIEQPVAVKPTKTNTELSGEYPVGIKPTKTNTELSIEHQVGIKPTKTNTELSIEHQVGVKPTKSNTELSIEHQVGVKPTKSNTELSIEHQLGVKPTKSNTELSIEHQLGVKPTKTNTELSIEHQVGVKPTKTNTELSIEHRVAVKPTKTNTELNGEYPVAIKPTKSNTELSIDHQVAVKPTKTNTELSDEHEVGIKPTKSNTELSIEQPVGIKPTKTNTELSDKQPWAVKPTKSNTELSIEHQVGIKPTKSNTELNLKQTIADKTVKSTTGEENEELSANRIIVNESSIMDQLSANRLVINPASVMEGDDQHGALWSDTPVHLEDNRYMELFGELTNEQQTLAFTEDHRVVGELISEPKQLVPDLSVELWGDLVSTDSPAVFFPERELTGELSNEPTRLENEQFIEIIADKLPTREGFAVKDYVIAVLGCVDPDLHYRRRPDLEPDKEPLEPLFEWVCTEGFVCDDWLIVPLRDFNFESPEQGTFFDPITFEPYFPTGQTDAEGDPYVLPPYSILNEPLSNGANVGGKLPMSIDPCNLYSFINHTVKIYDAHKSRFHASTPTDTISRVLNMLYEQVEKLISEWDKSKEYTPDELWRIYRFIRWMALGITNRFYRVKIDYTYGDFVENFDSFPFSNMITTEGSARKMVEGNGFVMEGHPIVSAIQNKVKLEFKLPQKTHSSTVSFEIANVVPDRPDDVAQGGVLFFEDFQGLEAEYKIEGDGWVTTTTQGGNSLAVEEPARAKTYRTSTFNVQSNAVNPRISFNYGLDTNMETKLELKKSDGTVVWQSQGSATYGAGNLNSVVTGDYYFEIRVPQKEDNILSDLSFTATQIQNGWKKVGDLTKWQVVGNVILEDANTQGVAMVINPQWVFEKEYEMECEFFTKDVPNNYHLIDWLGIVLNYKDDLNFYLFGTWSTLDYDAKGGLQKVVNGKGVLNVRNPTWELNQDFRFKLDKWHKLKAVVTGNHFTVYIDGTKYFEITDSSGWGYGSCGLAAYSNPLSSFRNFKYRGKPRIDAFIDNVKVEATVIHVPVEKPKYGIDFYLDGGSPRIANYSNETKRAYSFPILVGEHKASWAFKKIGSAISLPQDASFVDNIVVKGMKVVKADIVEEFIGCGGHLAVKLLIENLLEYYRRHHQGCKGERNIWIIE